MDLNQLVNHLIVDSKGSPTGGLLSVTADSSLAVFLPELVLCLTIALMLLVRVFKLGESIDQMLQRFTGAASAYYLALGGSLVALIAAAPWTHLTVLSFDAVADPAAVSRMEIFTGMLVYDTFAVFVRSFLLLFLVLFIVFTRISGMAADREDGPDLYTLVLGATLGMCLMATANHLMMVFMAVEMASVPSYVLAGIVKGRKRAGEAALKYSVYGAGAAGVMLYGISLLAGVLNTAHLPTMASRLAEMLPGMFAGQTEQLMVLSVGGLLLMAGLAFKLSAFPFHFWCPDVFEGATAEVDAFLSVASKAAALALLLRVGIGLGTIAPEGFQPGERSAAIAAAEQDGLDEGEETARAGVPASNALFAVADDPPAKAAPAPADEAAAASAAAASAAAASAAAAETPRDAQMRNLRPARAFIGKLVAFFAIITCTFGNLAAYAQTNIKRLLAYSTIAHAGYMMMAVPAVMALAEVAPSAAEKAAASVAIYVAVYLFMNLGAFAIVAFLRNSMHSEEINDYAGLLRHCPAVVICFALILFSLVGLPPLAGFLGKFAVFGALADGYTLTSQGYLLVVLLAGGINTVISLYYYLRVVKVMTLAPEPDSRLPFNVPFMASAFVVLLTIPTIGLMIGWDRLNEIALAAARHLIS